MNLSDVKRKAKTLSDKRKEKEKQEERRLAVVEKRADVLFETACRITKGILTLDGSHIRVRRRGHDVCLSTPSYRKVIRTKEETYLTTRVNTANAEAVVTQTLYRMASDLDPRTIKS